jgi:hypothetical protein
MAFQKTLSEPQAAAPVQPDTSAAQTLELVGNIVQQGFEGYQTAGLRDELTSAIEERIQTPQPDAADLAVQEADREMKKLAAAQQAGRMSSGDLETRVSAITRKYIRRVPGMADKFRNIRSSLIGDYAAELRALDEAEKDAKQQGEWIKKKIIDAAAKQNIDISQPFPEIAHEYQTRTPALRPRS